MSHLHRNGAGGTALGKTINVLLGPLSMGHPSFLSTWAVHVLSCAHLVPFLGLSRIRTISAEQVTDELGVSF